jgi:DNA transposition AAA+ family ATPase
MSNPKIYLGDNRNNEKEYWRPASEINQHMTIVGTSGSGKTETIKSIVHELKKNNISSLIIDFHDEFKDISELTLNLRKLSINPLEVTPGRRPQDVAYEVSNTIGKIYKLGPIQEAMLKNAIQNLYKRYKIDILEVNEDLENFPKFMEIKRELEYFAERKVYSRTQINTLMARISAFFEIDIFFEENQEIPFEEILSKTTTVELKDFPTEDIKAALAEFFITKLIYYSYTLDKIKEGDKVRKYVIVDEAHRLQYEGSPLDRLQRESRKYGIGTILSSQRPSDFTETVFANTGTNICMQLRTEKDAKFMAKILDIESKYITNNLNEPGRAIIRYSKQKDNVHLRIKDLKGRMSKREYEELSNNSKLLSNNEQLMNYYKDREDLKKELKSLKTKLTKVAKTHIKKSEYDTLKDIHEHLNNKFNDLKNELTVAKSSKEILILKKKLSKSKSSESESSLEVASLSEKLSEANRSKVEIAIALSTLKEKLSKSKSSESESSQDRKLSGIKEEIDNISQHFNKTINNLTRKNKELNSKLKKLESRRPINILGKLKKKLKISNTSIILGVFTVISLFFWMLILSSPELQANPVTADNTLVPLIVSNISEVDEFLELHKYTQEFLSEKSIESMAFTNSIVSEDAIYFFNGFKTFNDAEFIKFSYINSELDTNKTYADTAEKISLDGFLLSIEDNKLSSKYLSSCGFNLISSRELKKDSYVINIMGDDTKRGSGNCFIGKYISYDDNDEIMYLRNVVWLSSSEYNLLRNIADVDQTVTYREILEFYLKYNYYFVEDSLDKAYAFSLINELENS